MVKRSAAMFSFGMAALRLTMAPAPPSHVERTTSTDAVGLRRPTPLSDIARARIIEIVEAGGQRRFGPARFFAHGLPVDFRRVSAVGSL